MIVRKLELINRIVHMLLTLGIGLVWIVNGLFCKILGFAPRHEQIVARVLGSDYAFGLTKTIGAAEVFMAIWILSKIRSRLSALTQIAVVATMNVLEFFLTPDLLLFGHINSLVALLFIVLVYYNEFVLNADSA